MQRPIESAQYVSGDYTQTLDDHDVLASVGSIGDAYDNCMAESFVDTFKTELIVDRVWRTRSQMEIAIVEYISWFNNEPSARKPRRPSTTRDRRTLRSEEQDPDHPQHESKNLLTRSPRKPVRLSWFQRFAADGSLEEIWAYLITECGELDGVCWEWQAADGVMGKSRECQINGGSAWWF